MDDKRFQGALFMFNGLMQIPGRENRRAALRELHRVCAPGAPLLFTTHDRDASPTERALWRLETLRWVRGDQDPRLVEFGDRYFEDEAGRTFMHLPDRREVLDDLAATGWSHAFDAMRAEVAREPRAVREFSDECRFWAARRGVMSASVARASCSRESKRRTGPARGQDARAPLTRIFRAARNIRPCGADFVGAETEPRLTRIPASSVPSGRSAVKFHPA